MIINCRRSESSLSTLHFPIMDIRANIICTLLTTTIIVPKMLRLRASKAIKRFIRNAFDDQCRFSSSIVREQLHYDVLTVGAGPAGLSAAIRIKQLAISNNIDLSVCVIDKGSEVGAHIISGNVFEPRALDELFPNWKDMNTPIKTQVTRDKFSFLTSNSSFEIPSFLLPSQIKNHGNYIISLSEFVRWLNVMAEELGIEVYAGFAADEILYNTDNSVRGIVTKDCGIGKNGLKKSNYVP
eukprot:gene12709-26769_t